MTLPAYTPAEASNMEAQWLAHMPGAGVPRTYTTHQIAAIQAPPTTAEVVSQRRRTMKGIRDHGPISATQLATIIGMRRGRVGRAIQHLHENGKIKRSGDSSRTKWEAET